MPDTGTMKGETGTHSVIPGHSGMMIVHIRSPHTPEFRFEFHPETGKVYLIRIGKKPETGEPIAEHCDTHGRAIGFVQTYLRGLHEGEARALARLNHGKTLLPR